MPDGQGVNKFVSKTDVQVSLPIESDYDGTDAVHLVSLSHFLQSVPLLFFFLLFFFSLLSPS